ncbi:MAG: DUF5605 domain-containing protein [Eubacteriales bacterium]|nr:DUF5605 domain-containing protein [Eubacteriales bacterium]
MNLHTCPKWDIFEVTVSGPSEGNPFTEQWIRGVFSGANETVRCDGFYDGEGFYRVRFMPSFEGDYTYQVSTSFGVREAGSFTVTAPGQDIHGPVRVANTCHMAYEDGTPYYSIGTTCYVWELQSDEVIADTLRTLEKSAFNKIRFCIFPKHYAHNLREPRSYPYEGTPVDSRGITPDNFWQYTGRTEGNHWDFARFNPAYFRHIENCIRKLRKLGIEADLIMMHPYDRWGFSCMSREQDDLYWNYAVARFSAFSNVWWSLANEYDLMPAKTLDDWEHYADILCRRDPYRHMRSIHNCGSYYDYSRPWITHCSLQRTDLYKSSELTEEFRNRYKKPVIWDEIAYEGNIEYGWGNISPQEMLRRFWEAAVRGGYPGHGETYLDPEDILWWSHGGVLHGESHKRFGFLLDILKQTPGHGLKPAHPDWDEVCGVPDQISSPVSDYYLIYYSFMRPGLRAFRFDENSRWQVRVIDTWNMTVEDRGILSGTFTVELPGREYMAIQLRRL